MFEITNYDQLREKIFEAMTNRKVTQREIAKAIGVHQPTISRLLRGTNSPSIDLVFAVCEYLKVKIAVAVPSEVIYE